jgi:hypothetical protein
MINQAKYRLIPFISPLLIAFSSLLMIGNSSCTKTADEPLPLIDSIRIGLVAHYLLNQTPNDLTGNNPDIVPVNVSIQLSGRGNNGDEYAYYFAGNANSYARCILNNSKAVKGALSISFWAKETGPGKFSPRLFEFWPGNYGVGFYWFNWYQNKIKWAGSDFELPSNQVLDSKQWYHFVVTNDIYTTKVYCNGKMIARQNQPGILPPAAIQLSSFFEIGRLAQRPADAFEGAIRDFRIYNRSLSDNEVNFLSNQ